MMTANRTPRNWKNAARHGAMTGMKMTLLYAGAFTLYAVVRLVMELCVLPAPGSGRMGTVLATAASLITASLAITVVLLPLSALVGMGTSLLLHLVLPQIGSRFSVIGVLAISLAVAFAIADTVQLVLLPAAGFSPLELPFATWIFWFGLPTAIYIIAVGSEGRWLRSRTSVQDSST